MSKQQMTPWFKNGERPARRGVYEVSLRGGDVGWFSYWDGKSWGWVTQRGHGAAFDARGWPSCAIVENWRGLASDPKAKP